MALEIDALRASRKNPSVLKIKVLKVRGEDPDVLIFCYEGPDDVPVYEEWMAKLERCPCYEPIAGAGKQQLLALHKSLSDSADPLLEKVFFFVDRDFDQKMEINPNVFELDAYSIENLLCTEEVLESILRDEFRRAGSIFERARVRAKFIELRGEFLQCCMSLNFLLFVAQRTEAIVLKKPEKISEIVNISVDKITLAYADLVDIVVVQNPPVGEELELLRAEFNDLPILLKERGKYLLEMLRKWLRLLAEDLKSSAPIMFDSSDKRLPGDPSALPLRRFASTVSVPQSLSNFMARPILQSI